MLNRQDLSAIESLVDKKFKQELKPIKEDIQKIRSEQKEDIQRVRVELKEELKPIKEDIQGIKREFQPMKEDIQKIQHEITPIKEDIQKIRADQKIIINFFDKEYLELRKRVEAIEHHLGISSQN